MKSTRNVEKHEPILNTFMSSNKSSIILFKRNYLKFELNIVHVCIYVCMMYVCMYVCMYACIYLCLYC